MLIQFRDFKEFLARLKEINFTRYELLVDRLHRQLCLNPYDRELKNKPDLDTYLYDVGEPEAEIKEARESFKGVVVEHCCFYPEAVIKRS